MLNPSPTQRGAAAEHIVREAIVYGFVRKESAIWVTHYRGAGWENAAPDELWK